MAGTRKQRLWELLFFLVIVALIIGGLARSGILRFGGQRVFGSPRVSLNLATNFNPVGLANMQNGFSSVIDPVLPAVVNISSTRIIKQQNNYPGIFNDPLFRQFFGDQFGPPSAQPQTEREYSLGSGVIVNPDGYVLTNNHVVAGGSDIQVFTQARERYKARVIGTDPQTDIAVLKIDASGLPTVTIGDSSRMKVGDLVFAIGDPFGIGETATMGIVSATGRALGGKIEHYENFIQTDAAINPGNSGGALIEMHGDLIGINTAIITGGGGGGNEGIGFAIPVNMARNIMDQIVEHGKVTRGYLGVTIQGVSPEMAKAFGLSHGGGALIGDVTPDSPAAKARLKRGDIVLQLNGQPVNGPDDLSVRISEMAPGSVAHMQVYRDGQTKNIHVTVGEYPPNTQTAQNQGQSTGTALTGLQVENLTPSLAEQLKLPRSTAGVVVDSVDPSSPAAAAGIQRGDVIQEVNHKRVANVDEYQQALASTNGQPVLLLIDRQGVTHYVIVQPQ